MVTIPTAFDEADKKVAEEDLTWRLADQQDGQTKIETRLPKWAEKKADMVNHPPHYRAGGVECIDAIQAALTPEEFAGHCKACVLKYVWRERHKGGLESLKKGQWYLQKLIDNYPGGAE